jgi:cytidine deaminase
MTPAQQELFDAANSAKARAYAPYSNYPVGAAIRTTAGNVYAGCNVENAAYPQGWCAEASAIAMMVSAGEREIAEVLTVCDGELVGTCCGGCRQKLREFAPLEAPVYACGPEGIRATFTLADLLPHSFGPEHLAR